MAHYWFISTKYRRGAQLALVTCLLIFVVIVLGAYTRLTDAGLSCPDWPNCYGYLTAPHTEAQLQQAAQQYPGTPVDIKKAWTEMTHRYFAGFAGLFIIALSLSILFARKAKDLKSILIAISLLLLLGVQVTLGMLTVTEQLKPMIVLSHLLTGLSILCLLWWIYLDLYMHDEGLITSAKTIRTPWLWLAFLIVTGQIILGGWVSTHYAGLACIDFPYCNNQLLPTLKWHLWDSDLITIHMLHRIGALITAVYVGLLGISLLFNPSFRAIGICILALLLIQLTLGIANIILLRPVWIALLHHAVAVLLLLTLLTALVKAYFESREQRYGTWLT
ncbi:MAG TPA: COX15/CtaA family protein [Gammaproteobacteria bacterium]|nr:COX15/CtaA family protein [Gammaproteobacteria bacterium]